MSWIAVNSVRAKVYTTQTDDELQDLIDEVQEDIEATIGTVTIASKKHERCLANLSIAETYRRMKTNGELPYTSKMGPSHQINEIDTEIEYYSKLGLSQLRTLALRNSGASPLYVRAKPNHRDDTDE